MRRRKRSRSEQREATKKNILNEARVSTAK